MEPGTSLLERKVLVHFEVIKWDSGRMGENRSVNCVRLLVWRVVRESTAGACNGSSLASHDAAIHSIDGSR